MQLVEQDMLDVIVLRRGVLETSRWDMDRFLRAHGYRHSEPAGDYLVLWREFSKAEGTRWN